MSTRIKSRVAHLLRWVPPAPNLVLRELVYRHNITPAITGVNLFFGEVSRIRTH